MKTETFDAAGAGERLAAAIEARGVLLRNAATGRTVTAQEFRAAEERVRLAEHDATLASEIGKATVAEHHRRVIAEFQDQADRLAKRMVNCAAEHLAAARALDEAMTVARAAAVRVDDARLALEEVDRASHSHNVALTAEAATNAILAAQHPSGWPQARTAATVPVRFGGQLRAELVTTTIAPMIASNGPRDVVLRQAAEDVVKGAHSTLPKPVKAAA